MGAYLVDHPPRRSQMRRRRAEPSGVIVVHTAESTPDTVATDGGADSVANFIRHRRDAGSYHTLADSDSRLQLVPYDHEAFGDGTGSNPHAFHVSYATTAAFWPFAPVGWRVGAVEQAARACADYAHWLHSRSGIVIPARRITRAESERRIPGFISHGERDPKRRSDPGDEHPWDDLLDRYGEFTADLGNRPQEDPDMAIGISQHDDRCGVVDELCHQMLGNRLPEGDDRNFWIWILATEGYGAVVNGIANTPEARERRKRLRDVVVAPGGRLDVDTLELLGGR